MNVARLTKRQTGMVSVANGVCQGKAFKGPTDMTSALNGHYQA